MPLIDLGTIEQESFFGLIVPCTSGVEWTNQVGGVYCNHPRVEGIFIPLPENWKPSPDPLLDTGWHSNPALVENFLDASPELQERFEAPYAYPVGEFFGEAWVHVGIRRLESDVLFGPLLAPFYGQIGIITYTNSD